MTAGPGTIWQKQPAADGMGPPRWVQVGNIVGPAGAQGKQGNPGQAGPSGQSGPGLPPGIPLNQVCASVQASVVGGNSSFVNVGLGFWVNAGEEWTAEFHLGLNILGNSGVKFQFTGPANTTTFQFTTFGNSSTGTTAAFISDYQIATSTATAQFGGNTQGLAFARISLKITNGPNAGFVQLQVENTSTDNNQVTKGSYMVARRNV